VANPPNEKAPPALLVFDAIDPPSEQRAHVEPAAPGPLSGLHDVEHVVEERIAAGDRVQLLHGQHVDVGTERRHHGAEVGLPRREIERERLVAHQVPAGDAQRVRRRRRDQCAEQRERDQCERRARGGGATGPLRSGHRGRSDMC